ncbi:unnamed protein product [Cuscuta epithymum]|uniref:Secreted protein n=1 Tax=Cuscuta epithymum TaxID=186058 RepID=A0AAV0DVB3_9ASTE|nr:unnamed protein product [Cuscuta epithymum]
MSEFCFNFVSFCLCFSFELHVVLGVLFFSSRKFFAFKSGDEKSGLPVIGSVKPITGSTILIASTEVIVSKDGSRVDGRHKTFYHFVSYFISNCIVSHKNLHCIVSQLANILLI